MKYTSHNPITKNTGVSYTSQESADSQLEVMDNNNCINCTYCTDCTDCTRCAYCTDCTDCTDCTQQPIQLIGLTWIITIRANNTIKIGCQDHPRDFWESAEDSIISAMDSNALEFWKQYKTLLLSIPAPARSN